MNGTQKRWPSPEESVMRSTNPAETHRGEDVRRHGPPLREAVALVTGASRGIGRAIAQRLLKLGAKVAICARDAKQLDAAAAQLASIGGTVFTQAADVSRAADVEQLVRTIEARLGAISILVNNAGIGLFGAVQERSEEE